MTDVTPPQEPVRPVAANDSSGDIPQPATPEATAMVSQLPPVAAGRQMKRRNPLAVWLGLPLITLGIYHLVWYYKIHRELADYDPRRDINVVGPVLVLIFLSWTIVAPLISYYNTGKRIANSQEAAGLVPTCSAGIGTLLMLVLGLGTYYYQVELNKVYDVHPAVPEGHEVPLYA